MKILTQPLWVPSQPSSSVPSSINVGRLGSETFSRACEYVRYNKLKNLGSTTCIVLLSWISGSAMFLACSYFFRILSLDVLISMVASFPFRILLFILSPRSPLFTKTTMPSGQSIATQPDQYIHCHLINEVDPDLKIFQAVGKYGDSYFSSTFYGDFQPMARSMEYKTGQCFSVFQLLNICLF